MIPLEKVQALVVKHDSLEKELSTGSIDSKTFAQKSKEYSDLGNIITYVREYLKFDNDQKDLEQILQDKNSDLEMTTLAEKELEILKQKKNDYTNSFFHFSFCFAMCNDHLHPADVIYYFSFFIRF